MGWFSPGPGDPGVVWVLGFAGNELEGLDMAVRVWYSLVPSYLTSSCLGGSSAASLPGGPTWAGLVGQSREPGTRRTPAWVLVTRQPEPSLLRLSISVQQSDLGAELGIELGYPDLDVGVLTTKLNSCSPLLTSPPSDFR